MKEIYKQTRFFAIALVAMFCVHASNAQVTVTRCSGVPSGAIGTTAGTAAGSVTFPAADFAALTTPQIVDIEVAITWSHDNACGAGAIDHSQVGFQLVSPVQGTQTLAFSASGGTSSWTGTTGVSNVTTTFAFSGVSLFPVGAPTTGTYATNGTINMNGYWGDNPAGTYTVNVVNDGGAPVCVADVCITITACDAAVPISAVCRASTTVALDATGNYALQFSDLDNGSNSSCILQSTTFSNPNVDCSFIPISPINVTMTITDRLGRSDNCSSSVTVVDNTAPTVAECAAFPAIVDTVYLDATGNATYDAAVAATSSDACGIATELINDGTGTFVPVRTFLCTQAGNNIVNFRITDVNGNTTNCNALIQVFDTFPPTGLVCLDTTIYLDGTGNFAIDGTYLNGGFVSTCAPGGTQLQVNGILSQNYTCANLGANTATLTVRETNTAPQGGPTSASCTSTVTVVDTVSPVAICTVDTVYLDGTGNGSIAAATIASASTDNCGITNYTIGGLASVSYTCADIGINNETVLVEDGQGNSSTCSADITVLDTLAPTMVCQPVTVTLAGATGTLNATDVDNGSTDNCSAVTFTFPGGGTSISYNCADVGTQNVTLIGTDADGNVDSCSAVITVQELTAPVAVCATFDAYLDGTGNITVNATDVDGGSTDNCGIVTYTIDASASLAYTCADIGAQTVVFEVTDGSGNTDNCNATINVIDSISPVISCQNFTAVLDGTGNVTVNPADITASASDNCGSITSTINTLAAQPYTCADVGAQTATLEVDDGNGNVATCTATVTVEDNELPTVLCQPFTVTLDATGNGTLTPADIDGGTTDNCGAPTLTFSGGGTSIAYTCANIGTQNITMVATDANGNVDSCSAVVTIEDATAPVAVCATFDAYLDGTGNITVNATDVDGGSTDNCGIVTYTIDASASLAYTCADIGAQTVVFEVTDGSGNTDNCNATINVIDSISPVISCQNFTAVLDGTGNVTVNPADITASASDNCGSITSTINTLAAQPYTCADVGAQTATLEVDDGNGNVATCTATVTVEDNELPTASCLSPTVTIGAGGNVSITPADIDGGSTDNCGINTLTFTGGATSITYTCADVGTQNVTLVVTDDNGNVDSCQTTVTVQDAVNPTAVCNTPYNAYLTGTGTVDVLPSDIDGGSTDNCSIVNYTINGGPSVTFSCAQVGSPQNVTLEVTDPSGNVDNCVAAVTVLDTISPVASCQTTPVSVNLNASGVVTVSAAAIDNGSSDNCGGVTLLINGNPQQVYTCADVGLNNATLSVEDNAGNISTCVAQVDVTDNLPPLALCTSPTVYLGSGGTVNVTAAQITDPASSDNCSISSATINGAATETYTCADLTVLTGTPQSATLELTDPSGNTATCTGLVTVQDTTAPNALCSNITVFLDAVTGQVTVTGNDIDGGSTDNCNIVSYLINGSPSVVYNCADIGPNTAVLTVEDESGNTATCNATVTVVDNTNPTAVCQNITVYLDGTGNVTVLPSDIDGGSTDNCSPFTLEINNQPSFTYTCAQAGLTVNAQLSITDGSSNVAVCIAQVTVLDTISPTAICNSPLDVYLGTGGTVSVTAAQVNNGSTDNCSITSTNINGGAQVTFDCTDIGANSVTLNVRDASSNVGSCVSTVNVIDTLPPNALCRNITVYLDAAGAVTVQPTDVDNGSNDNCGAPSLAFVSGANITYGCADVGTQTATLVATDGSGNTDNCTSSILVRDTVSPVISCTNITVQLDPSTGTFTITPADVTGSATDACGIASSTINGAASVTFNCADVGTNNVTLLVTDANGNTATCVAVVTVEDVAPPVMVCQNITVQLDGTGNVTVLPGDVDNGSTDNCGITSLTLNGNANVTYGCADVGTNTVTLIGTDVNGNVDSCSATITVQDTISPNAVCQPFDAFLDGTGNVTVVPADVDGGSTDNCNIATYTVNAAANVVFGCADVGPNNVTLEVTDDNGNVSNCVAVVTVIDTISPTLTCQNITVQLDPSTGTFTITPADVIGAAADNCGLADSTINGQPTITYTCADVGANSVTVVVTDDNGNTNTCTATVTVEDVAPPVMVCQNITVQLDGTGNVTVLPGDVDNGSTDNCGILSLTLNGNASITYGCADVGTNTVTLIGTDVNGNVDSCSATITVQDTISPNAVCQPFDAYLDGTGNVTVVPADVDGGSTDNCNIATYTVNAAANVIFGCADVGPNNVTLEVTDDNGNTDNCVAVVTVIDTVSPTLTCANFNVQLDPTTGSFTITPADVIGAAADNCGLADSTINGQPTITYTCANVGLNNVTVVVTDDNGNTSTCVAVVTVSDVTPPNMVCQNITVQLDPTGQATILPGDIDNGTTDNCGINSLTINGQPSVTVTCADVGTTSFTLIATDVNGNVDSCVAAVTIQDTVPPTAICQNFDAFLDATGNVTVLPSDIDNSSTDNCAITTYTINSSASVAYTCTDVGANAATLEVTDAAGNASTCNATVNVIDTVAPTMVCQNITIQLDANGVATITPFAIDGGSSDACGFGSIAVSQDSFFCADVGPNNVDLIITDNNGNVGTCTAVVTVEDNVPPVALCQNISVYLDPTGNVTVLATQVDAGSTDNCTIDFVDINGQPSIDYDCSDVGTQNVVFTVTDVNGNTNSCNATIDVIDSVPPVAICQNITVQLDPTGIVIVNASSLDGGSTDNCAVNNVTFNTGNPSTTLDCSNVGANNLTIVVSDVNGNVDSCVAVVTVQDNTGPNALCNSPVTVYVDSSGIATVDPLLVDAGSTDPCGIDTMFVTPGTLNCSNIGALAPVTLSVVDVNGNTATCNADVNVLDTVSPTAICQNITVNLDNNGVVTVTPTQIDGGSADGCGVQQLLINGAGNEIYDCSDIGVNTATLQVIDVNGNTSTCNAQVTVQDTIAPDPLCRAPFEVYLTPTLGQVTVLPSDLDSLSDDNCAVDPPSYLIDGAASVMYDCSDISAPQTATLTVFDLSGNSSTCTVDITVRDTTAPTPGCVASITVNLSPTTGNVSVSALQIENGSSFDACAPPLSFLINGQPSFVYDCNDLGANTAVLSVTDASGNTGTCNATVNVQDITPPIANCVTSLNANLDTTGNVVIQGSTLNAGSTDNCFITQFLINGGVSQNFDCSQIGNNTVTLTVRDSSGNQSSCTSVINVRDLIAPDAVCPTQPVDAFLNASGQVTVSGTQIDSASTDNCTITNYLINGSATRNYTCANIGINNATLTVRDQSNNADFCSVQINVQDTVSPVASCVAPFTVNLNATTGQVFVNATTLNSGSADNCSIFSYQINGQTRDTFDCTNIGANNAILTVTDNFGNSSTCQTTITVQDNTAPTVNCTNGTFYLDNTGLVTVNPQDLATGVDACGILNWTIDGQPSVTYDCAVSGLILQDTIVATDGSGNPGSCIAQVTISDTISPVAICNNITVQLDSSGAYNLIPSDIDGGSFDNCNIVTYLVNGQPSLSFNCSDVGQNTVTLRVVDQDGNVSECQSTVTVEDNIAPVAICQNITVQVNSQGQVTIPAVNLDGSPIGSSDACGPLTLTINGQPSIQYNCSNTGVNTVSLEVTDANGNQSTCTSNITVQDVTPPNVTCQNFDLYLDNSGNGSITFGDVVDLNTAATFDNCGIFNFTVNGSNFINYDCDSVGARTVMVVAQDFSNNRDTCFATVNVIDSVGPSVNCNDITVNLTAIGADTLTLAQLGVSASDACGVDTITINPQIITCANIGTVNVAVTATDVNGNPTVCNSTVTVILDGPQPTSNAPATGLCEGQTLALFANPPATGFNYNYSWTGPGVVPFTSTLENPTISNVGAANEGFYIVEITPQSAPGCSISDTVFVDINVVDPPVVAATGQFCDNQSIAVLDVTNDTAYSGGTVTYQWFQNGTAVGTNNDSLVFNPISFADTGAYNIIVTVDGCSDTIVTPFQLNVNPQPAAFTPLANTPCEGDSLIIASNAPATGPFNYSWAGVGGYTSTDSTAIRFPVSLGDAGVYTVTITDPFTCTATSSVNVTIRPTPVQPNLMFNDPLCLDDILLLTDTTNYAGTVNYIWYTPTGTVDTTSIGQYTIPNAVEGTYTLVAVENGCFSPADTQNVNYEPAPLASIDAYTVPFRDSVTGLDVTINDAVRSGFSIALVNPPANGTATLDAANSTFKYVPGFIFFGIDSFTYEVCDPICPTICDTTTVILDVELDEDDICFMPNALSPNGDGINDELVIVCRDQFPNIQIQIFSRWGNRVYEGDPQGWNCQFNGKDLPDGTYFYILDYGDGVNKPKTGYIVIYR